MKVYEVSLNRNPSFNTVIGLTNTTFDVNNYVENRMATEAQISQLYQDIIAEEQRRDRCCRDIIIWETHVQVVRMNTLSINSRGDLTGGGEVISSFDENLQVGTMRRGLKYTVTFSLKWDNNLYVPRNVIANGINNCSNLSNVNNYLKYVNYRIVEDNNLSVSECTASISTLKHFWYGTGSSITGTGNNNISGHNINSSNIWDNFVHEIAPDGTVTIKDLRMNTNFNIIRYYTQWVLRKTADNQTIPDPTPVSP